MAQEVQLWQPGAIPEGLLLALRSTRKPLILTHIYPDGDALGSCVATEVEEERRGARGPGRVWGRQVRRCAAMRGHRQAGPN